MHINLVTYKRTNRHFDKIINISKKINIFFDVHLSGLFCRPKMPWFRLIYLIKIVSADFEIFRNKEAKKPIFSCAITILVHTLYGKVKK